MSESIPPNVGGSNKGIIVLIILGVVILAVAGYIIFSRQGASQQAPMARVVKHIEAPEPLVPPRVPRPLARLGIPASQAPAIEPPASQPENGSKRQGPAKITSKIGTINTKEVSKIINTNFGQLRACYERRLRKNPLLEGQLDVNIVINLAGKVASVKRNTDSINDTSMWDCVRNTITKWSFPKPTGGKAIIAKTFTFKKKS